MRVMVIMKASEASERGEMPSTELLSEMMAYNEMLVNEGVMLAGEGLSSSTEGARVVFDGNKVPVVVDGPFAETKELIAGFWIWQVKSLQEAVDWAKKIPNTDGEHHAVEIRRIFSPEDFGDALTPEIADKVEELSARGGNYAAEKP
jgi:hypothetical protein